MTQSIHQMISLVSYGNEWINGNIDKIDTESISTFESTASFKFVEIDRSLFSSKEKEILVANSITAWFEYLKAMGCKALKMRHLSIKTKSFQKGHSLLEPRSKKKDWVIEAVHRDGSDFWSYRWELDREKHEKNIVAFDITYGRIAKNRSSKKDLGNVEELKVALETTLNKLRYFAKTQQQYNWEKQFEFAIATLSSETPDANSLIKNMLPDGYLSLNAKQLLYAVSEAWIFSAAPSSWTQIKFAERHAQIKHIELNIELFNLNIKSITTVTNSNKTSTNID